MSEKRALAVNLGWEQRRLLENLVESGWKVFGVHGDSGWPRDLPFTEVKVVDLRNALEVLRFAEHHGVNAVVSDQCDYSHLTVAMVCEALGLLGPKIESAQFTVNKFLSRQRAHEAGLPIPQFELCCSAAEAREAAYRIGLPVIIKPVDSRGSFGVTLVDEDTQVDGALRKALLYSPSFLALTERFVGGTNVIVEGYCFRGKGHRTLAIGSKRHMTSRPYVHLEAVFPPQLPNEVVSEITEINDRAAKAFGFEFGPTTAEYVVDSAGRPWMIEMANRGGGVCIASHIVPWISGVDTTAQLVADSLGFGHGEGVGEAASGRGAVLRYLVLPEGDLLGVDGLEAAEGADGVAVFKYWGQRSGRVETPSNALERQGMLITLGETREAALGMADAAYREIRPRYAN